MKLRFALVIVALLVCAGLANAATITWTWGDKASDSAGTWTDPANWGGAVPGAGDTAVFPGLWGVGTQWGGANSSPITINSTVTVGAVSINTGDYFEYGFLGTGTLNVVNDFYIYDTWFANFQPVLNVGGVFRTDPSFTDARAVITFGAPGGAYTNGDTFTNGIYNYGCWRLDIGGTGTTVGGKVLVEGWTTCAAELVENYGITRFNGVTFNAGTTFDLEQGGTLQFTGNGTNFANVPSPTFNGGMLRLDGTNNIFPTYANGFQVVHGELSITDDSSLGTDDSNAISLGGTGSFGYLRGGAGNLTRQINLVGNGGVIYGSADFYNADFTIPGLIAGSGLLIKNGEKTLTMSNGANGLNTYSGGTVVAAGVLSVQSNRSLGTGNVLILPNAILDISAATNVYSSASVLIQSDGSGAFGFLRVEADMALPTVDPSSTGTILLNTTESGSITSIGNGYLGTTNVGAFTGASLAVATDNTYHIGGCTNPIHWDDWHNMVQLISPNVLTGSHDVLFNYGGAFVDASNDYTGTTTLENMTMFWTDMDIWVQLQPVNGGTVLGSPTGNVVMNGGQMRIMNYGAVTGLQQKGDLSYASRDILGVDLVYAADTGFQFASLTRTNRGQLEVVSWDGPLGTQIAAQGNHVASVSFTTPPPVTNGIVSPSITTTRSLNNTLNFATYAGNTLTDATPTQTSLPAAGLTAGTDVVTAAATALSDNQNLYALQANGAITGSAYTVTVGSGGLIFNSSDTSSANFKAGSDGLGEMIITTNSNPTISGTITAGSLTKGGNGNLTLTGNNTGLSGLIVVNGGQFSPANDAACGNATGIELNGGCINAPSGLTKTLYIGPAGGVQTYYWVWPLAPLSDLTPGTPGGPFILNSAAETSHNNDAFSGPLILENGGMRLDGAGSPGMGPVTIYPGQYLVTYGYGWANNARWTLLSGYNGYYSDNNASVVLCNEIGPGQTFNFGSIVGSGNISFGQYGYKDAGAGAGIVVGGDNTNADYYGSIFETSYGAANLVTKVGTGVWTLWGDSTWHGATTINGGTLRINGGLYSGINGTVGAADVAVNSTGTLSGIGTVQRNVDVTAGGTLAGGLTIDGNVFVNGVGSTVNTAGATFNGTVQMGMARTSGTPTSFTGTNDTINGALALYHGAAFTGTNETVNAPGLTLNFGDSNGAATFTGTNTVTTGYLNLNNGTISGTNNITASAAVYLNSSGYGPCALTGTNTVTSPWFVSFANSLVSGANTFNGAVYMWGGTFNGNNTVNGPFTTAASSNAIISPHNGAAAGTLAITGAVSLDHSTTLNFNLGAPGTIGSGINDLITVTGDLSLDGTLNVNALSGFNAGIYRLFNYTGTLTEPSGGLTQGTMPAGLGYTYTVDTGTTGQVNLDVVNAIIPGDTNHDGFVNSLDIDAIYHNFGAPATSQWKVSTDGLAVGQEDVTYELRTYFHTNYGDANLDYKTDFLDFQVLLDHWQATGPNIGWAQGDFNGDYTVDFLDFQKLLDYWNPGGWNFAPAQTPEPASLSLILLGGLALLRQSRKNVGSGE